MAEWSKALRLGRSPQGRGFKPHRCHFAELLTSNQYKLVYRHVDFFEDTVAEWLRRRPAKPMCSARVGSNPIGVAYFKDYSFRLSFFSAGIRDPSCATLA